MIIEKSTAKGSVLCPPSKSMAHRHLICAALAEGKSVIHNIDLSEDIKATLGCLKELGAEYEFSDGNVIISGIPGVQEPSGAAADLTSCDYKSSEPLVLNCNESGSTLRFFIPIVYYFGIPALFKGSQVLMTRPQDVYKKIAEEEKLEFLQTQEGIRISGQLKSADFKVPGNISSQFITALLFVLPLLKEDSTIELTGGVESKPYIDMTLQVQALFGVKAMWINENTLKIPGGQKYKNCESTVEGDYSNAAFLEAFNFLGVDVSDTSIGKVCDDSSGKVHVGGLNPESLQGDKIYREYFRKLHFSYAKLDISDCPDLGPILFVMAAANHGGEFTGTKRLAIKESDRGKVMCQELQKFGVKTLFEENRIVIY
ncbi:MAG: hypothetical protein K6E78_00570, partial [Treponema sp.]|nr:hypothetical protein [Treponema sp.]